MDWKLFAVIKVIERIIFYYHIILFNIVIKV